MKTQVMTKVMKGEKKCLHDLSNQVRVIKCASVLVNLKESAKSSV